MVLDELKLHSDDATFTEDHIIFLLSKYRAFLLKQRYADIKRQVPESNYQTACLKLIEVPTMAGDYCISGTYLRSEEKIPVLMKVGNPTLYTNDYYQGDITLVDRDRMKYVGYNKYLQNIIYASIGPDNYLYLKSSNPQYLHLEKVHITGLFEDPQQLHDLQCNNDNYSNDILDSKFPIEEALIPPLLELVLKELLNAIYRPEDDNNNANDDLSNLSKK